MAEPSRTIKTWDLPTRLFHWLLVALIINAYLTYEFGDVMMTYHMWNGYAILTLCLYRILWGLFGSNTARFSQFIKGPGAVLSYLRSLKGRPEKYLGHNPAGGLMILALLGLVLAQGAMGLFTSDDILVEGPLVFFASSSFVDTAGSIHRIGYWVIVGFAAVHVSAVFFYLLVKKENLIKAMVHGKKDASDVPDGKSLEPAPLMRAVVLFLISAGCVWLVVNLSSLL